MRQKRQGFTLIELLVVIAIIAILAAIVVPVFARAKADAARNGDIADMNELRSALQLYREDQGAYPPALLGYVERYTSGPNTGSVIPADQVDGYLYAKRVGSFNTFVPNRNEGDSRTATTNAAYPNADPRAVGSAPQLDLNGDGVVDAADDPAGARQKYDSSSGFICTNMLTEADMGGGCGVAGLAEYYAVSGYDVFEVPTAGGPSRWELRYSLFWTDWGLTTGSGLDDPRQLGYNDPHEQAIITWNTSYRDYDTATGVPVNGNRDIALLLGGSARPFSSRLLHSQSWRINP